MNNKKLTTSLVASLLLASSSNLYSQDLSQITVSSATKSEQSIKDVTSNIEVITKEEIEELKKRLKIKQSLQKKLGDAVQKLADQPRNVIDAKELIISIYLLLSISHTYGPSPRSI